MTVHVLAVVDSESFLKWSAATLDRITAELPEAEGQVVVIKGPLEPSPEQVRSALSGTRTSACPVVSRRQLKRLVASYRPDVVLVGATGPVAEMIALTTLRAAVDDRPVLVVGSPGIAMSPAATVGVKWRYRWCDACIVHSPREVEAFATAFARHGAHPRVILTRFPFLKSLADPVTVPVSRVVFAPQSIHPHGRADRVAILEHLADLQRDGFEVVVKLRTRPGEQQTHYEALPYETLWRQEHERLGSPVDALRFESGSMMEWLAPGTALMTISSTAALESLALGLPTALISDFGVSTDLANAVYEGSGCLVPMAGIGERLRLGLLAPDADWMAANYLHTAPSELGSALRHLITSNPRSTRSGRAPRPVSPLIHLYSAVKSDAPMVWYPAKWTRAVVGRRMTLH